MSIDLKPCPHCGSEAAFRVVSHQLLGGEHPLAGMEYIDCNNKLCGASTIAMYSTGEDCKPLLAERWNCRFGAAIKAAQHRVAVGVDERDYKALYLDLIMQVAKKYPGETRHDTAKKYIRFCETPVGEGRDQAAAQEGK